MTATQAELRHTMAPRASKFRQAGLTYLIVGAVVVVFTLAAGLVPPSRAPRIFLLLPGLVFVILFGTLIIIAPALWRWRWTVRPTLWLVRLLTITNAGRTLLFLLNALGWNVHVLRGTRLELFVLHSDPAPLFLVDAGLTGFITLMLARTGWTRK